MSMLDVESLPPEPPPMADPGGVPMPSEPPADLSMLAGGGEGGGVGYGGAQAIPGLQPGVDIDRLSREAAAIQRDKAAATEKITAENNARLEADRVRLQKQYEATGIGPDELKPWDNDKAREQFRHDPIQEFGSIGSIFAIVASAFTNRPMQNAMMGSAAAITAAKEGKSQEFDRAYKAWQDNTKLAIERNKIQNQQFNNASTLFTTDMSLGAERAKEVATRYGDKQMSLLLDNGLYDKAIELNKTRQEMGLKLAEALPKLAIENYKMNDLLGRGYNPQAPESSESQKAIQAWRQDWTGQKYDDDVDFARKWWDENPRGTSEEFSKAFGEHTQRKLRGLVGGSSRVPKPDEARLNAKIAELRAAHPDWTEDQVWQEANQVVKRAALTPTGGQLDHIDRDINQMDNAMKAATTNIEFLESHIGGAGIGGKATRLAERVGNIFGSDETARVEFEKRVNYMKMVAPRLITMSAGRPLASEAERVNSVIAGLGWGDTTANSLAAMKTFNELMAKMQADAVARRKGQPNQPGQTTTPPTAGGYEPAWKSAPLVK